MIVHIVLFEPRPDLPLESKLKVLADLRAAATAIPSVRRCRVGRRILHGVPGYEQAMRDDYSYAVVIEFDDVEGLQAYLRHPGHAAIGRHFAEAAVRALAYDYEMSEAAQTDAAHVLQLE